MSEFNASRHILVLLTLFACSDRAVPPQEDAFTPGWSATANALCSSTGVWPTRSLAYTFESSFSSDSPVSGAESAARAALAMFSAHTPSGLSFTETEDPYSADLTFRFEPESHDDGNFNGRAGHAYNAAADVWDGHVHLNETVSFTTGSADSASHPDLQTAFAAYIGRSLGLCLHGDDGVLNNSGSYPGAFDALTDADIEMLEEGYPPEEGTEGTEDTEDTKDTEEPDTREDTGQDDTAPPEDTGGSWTSGGGVFQQSYESLSLFSEDIDGSQDLADGSRYIDETGTSYIRYGDGYGGGSKLSFHNRDSSADADEIRIEFPLEATATESVSVDLYLYNPVSTGLMVYLRRDDGEQTPWWVEPQEWVHVQTTLEGDSSSTVHLLVGNANTTGSFSLGLDEVYLEAE